MPFRCFFVVHEMAVDRKPMPGVLVGFDDVAYAGRVQSGLQALTLLIREGRIDARGADLHAGAHLRREQVGAVGLLGGGLLWQSEKGTVFSVVAR